MESQSIAQTDLADLRRAKAILEYPSLTIRIADTIGRPIELGLEILPANWQETIGEIARTVLLKGLELAIYTLGDFPEKRTETWWSRLTADQNMRDWMHKTIAALSGASGGPFGAAALPIELPISTGIILRSIADIARSEGQADAVTGNEALCMQDFDGERSRQGNRSDLRAQRANISVDRRGTWIWHAHVLALGAYEVLRMSRLRHAGAHNEAVPFPDGLRGGHAKAGSVADAPEIAVPQLLPAHIVDLLQSAR